VPTENLRFRDESLVFKVSESATEEEVKRMNHYEYPHMIKVCRFLKQTHKQTVLADVIVQLLSRVYNIRKHFQILGVKVFVHHFC
jgi:ATP-binding cassette, sub-family E, member 1